MNNLLLYVAAMIAAGSSAQTENYGSFDNVSYVRNYDGDTITVNIDGVHNIIGKEMPIRVLGIDTPEIAGECPEEISAAEAVRDFVTEQLTTASVINLKNVDRGKYFRILADVEYDGINLATILLNNEFALPYDGSTRPDWCEHLNQ